MITASLNGCTVSPPRHATTERMACIASEIAERIEEMNEARDNAGTDFILRLATLARLDRGAFAIVVAVQHGNTDVLTDSYAERAEAVGRKKQTVHYRTIQQIETVRAVFPEVAIVLDGIRNSVAHHEDPISQGQVIRDANEER
jgi:hypothetical protein